MGNKNFNLVANDFYLKPIYNLSTFEWQHATADYEKVLKKGLSGIIEEIDSSLTEHTDNKEQEFLRAVRNVVLTLISWAHKCSEKAAEAAESTENGEYKQNLITLSETLKRVPEMPQPTKAIISNEQKSGIRKGSNRASTGKVGALLLSVYI